jgi:ATP-dependent Lon protease
MEVIRIPGYLETEKREIARRFLLPAQLERHGLAPERATLDDAGVGWLIEHYTREAGVRELDRTLGRVARKLAREVAEDRGALEGSEALDPARLRVLLGPPALLRSQREESAHRVGVATGLAWTPAGGELLEVEVAVLPGSGKIQLTGTLGDVMKESAVAALSYARARATALGLHPHFHREVDVHIHVPEGATPKDGPSAGVTMAVALVSALTGRPTRPEVALTGEVTLRGRVLPVGGIREKTVAALRHGLETVLLPRGNQGELEQLPPEVRARLRLVPVEAMDRVLEEALEPLARSAGAAPGAGAGPAAGTRSESGGGGESGGSASTPPTADPLDPMNSPFTQGSH